MEKEKEEVEWRKKNKEEWEKNQEKERRKKVEKELEALRAKVARMEKEEKSADARIPSKRKDLREKVMAAISVYTNRHGNIRSRDSKCKRKGKPTREDRGGVHKPMMTPVDRKAKVEKEVKDSQYTLDIANARLMLRPQSCTDRRLTNARRHLHVYLAALDSDPEDADQSDDTVRASKLLRLLEERKDPASIQIELRRLRVRVGGLL